MNIYKVKRISEWDYDNYVGFVCFARNEDEAKNLNPSFVEIDNEHFNNRLNDPNYSLFKYTKGEQYNWLYEVWVKNKDYLTVTKLGTSDSTQVGIIMKWFCAG